MKITKYNHACLVIEKENQSLVVDPGGFSSDFIAPNNAIAVVITHAHADHFDPELLTRIHANNPDMIVLGPQSVTSKVNSSATKIALPGDTVTIGLFSLAFFGGEHAFIHDSVPAPENVGVLIDNLFYYPGDSFYTPAQPVDVLAIPAAAPWMKIGEAMDYLATIKPRLAFPTHDAILSEKGKALSDQLLGSIARKHAIEYRRLGNNPLTI